MEVFILGRNPTWDDRILIGTSDPDKIPFKTLYIGSYRFLKDLM